MSIYEDAKGTIEQWENHGRHRTYSDGDHFWDDGTEPGDVAMAREVVRLTEAAPTHEHLIAIAKAASSLRFYAQYDRELTDMARQELYDIAAALSELLTAATRKPATEAITNERTDT